MFQNHTEFFERHLADGLTQDHVVLLLGTIPVDDLESPSTLPCVSGQEPYR